MLSNTWQSIDSLADSDIMHNSEFTIFSLDVKSMSLKENYHTGDLKRAMKDEIIAREYIIWLGNDILNKSKISYIKFYKNPTNIANIKIKSNPVKNGLLKG